jgi:hypothetical protein
MSYLSGYREQQSYENANSIPPFDVCVSSSPLPRGNSAILLYAARTFPQ